MTIAIWSPRRNLVIAITQAPFAIVSTDIPHGYTEGDIVKFYIPESFGMQQANLQQTTILDIPTSTTFTTSMNSTLFDAFVVPVAPTQKAQVVPVGEINSSLDNPFTVLGAI